jgi:DNA-binding CsgD family transcriptional regulator
MLGTKLSAREREILLSVADGYSSKEIARDLGISPRTVECHVEHIKAKLGVRNRASLAARAASMIMWEELVARNLVQVACTL